MISVMFPEGAGKVFCTLGPEEYPMDAVCITGKYPGRTVLITAQIHSGEYPGTPAVIHTANAIDPDDVHGRLIGHLQLDLTAILRENRLISRKELFRQGMTGELFREGMGRNVRFADRIEKEPAADETLFIRRHRHIGSRFEIALESLRDVLLGRWLLT